MWSTPEGGDIALKEAASVSSDWLKRSVNDGARSGSVTVDGRTWERYAVKGRAQLSSVLRGAGEEATLVATGVVPEATLTSFVDALQPVAPAS